MAAKKTFDYKLNDTVKLESGETGKIVARMQSVDSNPQYMLRYKAADGCQRETWIYESALSPVK